ncbi:hypothetical protein MMC26_003618 [Xylographa opegraphella]|nr:hypothetical protein [Xylographa opegraphella]
MDKELEMSQVELTSSTNRSSSLKRESSHFNDAAVLRRRTSGHRLKTHLRRWWWLHLIIGIAVLLLITLLLVYVGFPHITQSGIDNSTLNITSVSIANPTESSFFINQASLITSSSAYHPQLDAFNASLSLLGQAPYAYVTIPAIHATATATADVNQVVQIANLSAFAAFTTALLNNETVALEVSGTTALHEMAFPETSVAYKKSVQLSGLNRLAGFDVPSFRILLAPSANGTNLIGEVLIPNPSVFTFAMGNVTLDLSVAGRPIGTSTLADLVLAPGNNTVPMAAATNQSAVLELITATYTDGLLPVDVAGRSSVYDGVHLPYYEQALASVTQHVVLDVGAALKAAGVVL